MPLRLKNTRATYQRMIQTCLENQIGRMIKAYVDDVVVKTKHTDQLVDNLRQTFDNLQAYDICLNPEKCVFGVSTGKLLGFIVSHKGIEAKPVEIRVLSQLAIPTELKHVQKLAGCVEALSRFISRLGEKALPRYKLHKMTKNFQWTDEATAALKRLKHFSLATPSWLHPVSASPCYYTSQPPIRWLELC